MRARSSHGALLACVLLIAAITVMAQERRMGVRQPPEAVFDAPVEDVLPQLTAASPTGENGRVGGELVFWGYRLADGRPAYFFACAILPDVNCEERIDAICPAGTTVLERGEHPGKVVRRRCREMAIAAPGELHPGCNENLVDSGLIVGLAACD